jgi:hypothetical protein
MPKRNPTLSRNRHPLLIGSRLQGLSRNAPVLFHTLLFWLLAELIAIVLLPAAVPRNRALSWYLGPEARQATQRFLDDRHTYLTYDPLTGWRNRPNCGRDIFKIDSLGSRSTHPLGLHKGRPVRLLFLGSSLVNGGFRVTAEETIAGCSEDSLTEAGNFGTMLYSLDQMVLAYTGGLYRFGADVVVVGLPAQLGLGLTNRYVPFLQRSQVLMPCFKPRFVEAGDSLRVLPVPSIPRWRALLTSPSLVESIAVGEGSLDQFESYRRFGLTPVAAGLRQLSIRARNLRRLIHGTVISLPLAIRLMHHLESAAARHQARVVYMLLPSRQETSPVGWRRRLPDAYGNALAALRVQGFTVLDGRSSLLATGLPMDRLYEPDGIHYRAVANRALAGGLRELIKPPDAHPGEGRPRRP